MGTMLEVQSPCADLRLRYKHPRLTTYERKKLLLFRLVGIIPTNLYGVTNKVFQKIAFIVQVTPYKSGLSGTTYHSRYPRTPLLDRPPPLLPLPQY